MDGDCSGAAKLREAAADYVGAEALADAIRALPPATCHDPARIRAEAKEDAAILELIADMRASDRAPQGESMGVYEKVLAEAVERLIAERARIRALATTPPTHVTVRMEALRHVVAHDDEDMEEYYAAVAELRAALEGGTDGE